MGEKRRKGQERIIRIDDLDRGITNYILVRCSLMQERVCALKTSFSPFSSRCTYLGNFRSGALFTWKKANNKLRPIRQGCDEQMQPGCQPSGKLAPASFICAGGVSFLPQCNVGSAVPRSLKRQHDRIHICPPPTYTVISRTVGKRTGSKQAAEGGWGKGGKGGVPMTIYTTAWTRGSLP
jgi:hypothetical protein